MPLPGPSPGGLRGWKKSRTTQWRHRWKSPGGGHWRSTCEIWNITDSLFFEHSNEFCKCLFNILKLSLWNLHWKRQDIQGEASKQLGPVVSPWRFANLRNNGAGQLTIWISNFFFQFWAKLWLFFQKISILQPTKKVKIPKNYAVK